MGTKFKKISRSFICKAVAFVIVCVTVSLASSTLLNLAVRGVFPSLTAPTYQESYRMLNWRDVATRDLKIMAQLKSEENIQSGNTVDVQELEERKKTYFYRLHTNDMSNDTRLEEKYGKEIAKKISDPNYEDFYYNLEKQNFELEYAEQIQKMKEALVERDMERFLAARQRLQNREGILYFAGDDSYTITNLADVAVGENGNVNVDKNVFVNQPAYYLYEGGMAEKHPNRSSDYLDNEVEYSAEYGAESQTIHGVLYVALDEAYVQNQESLWLANRKVAEDGIIQIAVLILLALIFAGYLFCVTGRRPEDEEIHFVLIDRMFVEINAVLIVGVGIIGGAIIALIVDNQSITEIIRTQSMQLFLTEILGLALAVAVVLELLLSVIRRSKARQFVHYSLICRILKFLWKWTKRFFSLIGSMFREIGKIFTSGPLVLRIAGLTLGSIFIVFLLTLITVAGFFPAVLLLIGVTLLLLVVVTRQIKPFDSVVKGVQEIRSGNLNYKIKAEGSGDMARLAEDINTIADGLKESAKQQLKAERMKSELITNVSHDLKTPLTSIINYADLLSKEHLSPEEANDYVKIIERKAERLKVLTQDLFEISRIQSGNMTVEKETIDICLLVKQSLAELDEKISKSSLTFKTNIPESEILIDTDGRKLSRVFENLIVNALKYSLENSRVYVDVKQQNGMAQVEFKNIANYEMNFSEEEILERFVRGDKARTTEGNGLGLAIAQSYTEACGGTFAIHVDGDLFKASISFPVIEN